MDLSGVVKAYDVRGTVPDQLNEDVARALGAAFADLVNGAVTGAAGDAAGRPATIVTAHDMRETGPGLARAFADGAMRRGASIIEIGLASTDMLYFASGHLGVPGAMFTASHNPAQYNGIKFCRAGAVAVGRDTGLAQIRTDAERYLSEGMPPGSVDGPVGSVEQRDLLDGERRDVDVGAELTAALGRREDLGDVAPHLAVALDEPGVRGVRRIDALGHQDGDQRGGLPVVLESVAHRGQEATDERFRRSGGLPVALLVREVVRVEYADEQVFLRREVVHGALLGDAHLGR